MNAKFWLFALLLLGLFPLAGCKDAPPGAKLIGQPIDIQYTALDGRNVDTAQLRGKVVLIDFWATWCPPCVKEVPVVKAAYDKLHAKGFEVVAISMDDKKEDLTSFVAKENIPWPQYFDPSGFDNKFGKQFRIEGIPTMWLLDKSGKLRDIDATDDLAPKVEKLLAESEPAK